MAFEHVADAIRRPRPGTVASVGSVVEDLVRGVRQVQRQIGNGRRLTETRTGTLYTGSDGHGPGSDLSHTFSFSVGSSGSWVAQISAVADTDATSGLFGIAVAGGAPAATLGGISLSGTGDASGIVTAVVNAGLGDLDVLCLVAATATSIEFTVNVTAYRISA